MAILLAPRGLAAAVALLLALGGCAGGSLTSVPHKPHVGTEPVSLAGDPDCAEPDLPVGFLPSPQELLALLPEPDLPRSTSYDEMGLVSHGKDYNTYFPSQRVNGQGDGVWFDPEWGGSHKDPSRLAYCIYAFWIPGYDRSPRIRYGWEVPPVDIGTVWLGLVHLDRDVWDWHRANEHGILSVDSFDPYIGGDDNLFLAVVHASAQESKLRYVGLGPSQTTARIDVTPPVGLPPSLVAADASASLTAVGTIDRYVWDWDEDGVFEEDTGATASASHLFSDLGDRSVAVRVTNSYGEQSVARAGFSLHEPWQHSWGRENMEEIRGVAVHGQEGVFATGYTKSAAAQEDVLLMRWTLDGAFQWAKSWGEADTDRANAVVVGDDDDVYVAGDCSSFGAGTSDVLLQRWDTSGQLVWSRTWGGASADQGNDVARRGDRLYVTGRTDSFGGLGDALLLVYDLDGNLQWVRAVGGDKPDFGAGIEISYNYTLQANEIHIAGETQSFVGSGTGVLYLRFTTGGDYLNLRACAGPGNISGTCIGVIHGFENQVFIGGNILEGTHNMLLLRVGLGAPPLCRTWDGGWSDRANGLLVEDDALILCGSTGAESGDVDAALVSLSPTGALQKQEAWTSPKDDRLYGLASYPGGGLAFGGYTGGVDEGAWSSLVGATGEPSVLWVDLTEVVTPTAPAGVLGEPAAAVVDVTGGVIDSGNGFGDALVGTRAY